MRRATLALALIAVPALAAPASAQWFGPGPWARPCFGPCGPAFGWGWRRAGFFALRRPFWAGPGFGRARFGPDGVPGRRLWWRRAMRWRRFLARQRRAAFAARPAPAARPAWTWAWHEGPASSAAAHFAPGWTAPARPAAVAVTPALPRGSEGHRAVAPSLITSAVLLHRPVARPAPVVRAMVTPPRPSAAAVPRPASVVQIPAPRPAASPPAPRPAVLRSDPVPPVAPAAAAPAPAAPTSDAQPAAAPPARDVPVAPLD